MDIIRKNRILFWALIFLLVVNLSAVGSYFLFSERNRSMQSCNEMVQPAGLFRSELGLNDEQALEVGRINKEYREASAPIADAIRNIRSDILDELSKDDPDSTELNTLSAELAALQLSLQKENIHQYLDLKKVCTPEQTERLSNLFRELYRCPMQSQGMQHRYRHGQGMHGTGN